ncbi:hypothetical protein F5Y03DRAFT_396043 [Xylaria venustula]|nr:hypothetical protein F5Y03DRAFT_396043 [Xylaria venustula]
MAVRCSACNQWIKTTGGTHQCPGTSKNRISHDGLPDEAALHRIFTAPDASYYENNEVQTIQYRGAH